MNPVVLARLKTNLIWEHSEEAQAEAIGMLCIPFRNESKEGADELFQELKRLVERV